MKEELKTLLTGIIALFKFLTLALTYICILLLGFGIIHLFMTYAAWLLYLIAFLIIAYIVGLWKEILNLEEEKSDK